MVNQKITQAKNKRAKLLLMIPLLVAFLPILVIGGRAFAIGGVSEGYSIDSTNVKVGMAVSQVTGQENKAELTSNENSVKFVGIITTLDDNIVSITDQSKNILVAKDGEVNTYVTNLNGSIEEGDLLSASPIKGTLMKADSSSSDSNILAIASQNIDDISTTQTTFNDVSGVQETVEIGLLKTDITRDKVAKNSEAAKPSFLILFGESLTGKSVSQIQVVAAIFALLVILVLEGSIIYGAINSTITALGRNPLSRKAALKQLLQVSWLALVVLIFGVGVIYLILWI